MSKKKNKTSKNDNNLAIAYYRYSSHSQNELSIDQQRAQAQKYAETHGLQIVREYEDKAMTGTNDDRPGFQQMLSEVGKIKPAALILWKTDRLGRDRYDLAISKKKIRDAGCEILYIAEALPTSTPEASLMEGLLESMAEFYSKPLFLFRRTQKSCADPGIDKIGDKGAEAHIREEMIGHVDAVIAIEQHENTGSGKADPVPFSAPAFEHIHKHRQSKHHAGNSHVAAGPALEVIVAAGKVGHHLPPLPELAFRVIKRDKIFVTWTGAHLLEPEVHVVRCDTCHKDRRTDCDKLIRIDPVHKLQGHEGYPGIEHCPEQPAQNRKGRRALPCGIMEQSADDLAVVAVGVIYRHKPAQKQKHPCQSPEPVALGFQSGIQTGSRRRIEAIGKIGAVGGKERADICLVR